MQTRTGNGRVYPAGSNGRGPEHRQPEEDKAGPKTLRSHLQELKRNAQGTVAGVPRAWKLVWETHRGFTLSMAFFSVLFGFMPTATAWVSKLLIDAVVAAINAGGTARNVDAVVFLALVQFGLYVGNSLLQTVRNINQQALQELTARRVQLMVMRHANRLDLSFFENPEFYDSLQQAQSGGGSRPLAMVEQMFGLVRSLITFLSMIALIARLGWVVALVALLAPIPSFIAGSRYGWQGYHMMRRQSPDRRRMSYFLSLLTQDTYNKEIKLFGLGSHFIERWREIAERFYRENRGLVMRRYLMGFAWGSLTTIVTSGTYLYVALQAVAGKLTLGDLTFYTQAIGSVQSSFGSILDGLSSMYENNLYLNNLYDFLDYEPAIQSPPNARKLGGTASSNGTEGRSEGAVEGDSEAPTEGAASSAPTEVAAGGRARQPAHLRQGIEFRNVTFAYPGKSEPALRNVSFTIRPDEAVALVGQNGAGKTTIVKLLTRLYDPDEGQVLLDGHDIREYDLDSLRAAIGVIFQDYVTYYFSARDNIGVGRLEEMENLALVEQSAARSGADGVIQKLPKGYDTTLGRWFDEGYQLSGGEWQKVALARAFMRDADILVLDEPTASLDARAEYEIFARMKELTEGKMAVFISHRFSTVRLADRIFVLENGALTEAGTHAELLALGGIYAELFNLQAAAYK